ncbi:hypothetical protein HY439_03555 [Candidatus Microgenomates bacterium]|nr:hypothetical protein [Candidatus Microgenomates bacterium]
MVKSKILTIVLALVLIGVNTVLVWPLFIGEYDRNMASIGVAHILNARYLANFLNQAWNPFWYGGFPNHLIYPLLAPITLALIQKVFFFLSMAQIYRIIVASAYVLTPATLFFLVHYFTKRKLVAFFASLFYLLTPSANYFLITNFNLLGEKLFFAPWQLSVISDYGEGPHIIALSIVPLVVIFYWRLLRAPSFFKFLLTAVLMGVVVSINLFSAYALGYFLLGVLFSEMVLGKSKQKLFINILLLPVIYALIAFCYDVSMLVSLSKSGYMHPENVFRLPPVTTLFLIAVFIAGPVLFIVYEIFKKKPKLQNGLVLGIWFLIFWLIPYAFYKGYWFGSQPNRYMPELNIAAAIIAAVLLIKIYDYITSKSGKLSFLTGGIVLILYLAGMVYISRGFIQNGWQLVSPNPDIKTTSEYKIAKWLEENIVYETGERAYLSGSPAFFLNEFAPVPQIRGDEDNAQANHWWADITYQVNAGEESGLAIGWLEALNVRFAVVDFNANTPYKDFKYPDKFLSLLEVASIDGFRIFEIPGNKNIVQAVDLNQVRRLKPFSHPVKPVLDEEGLKNYLEAIRAISEGVTVNYSYPYRTAPNTALIEVKNAGKDTGILFKSTFDPGWKAKLKTGSGDWKEVKIGKTGPDFMLVKSGISGDYTLKLSYHRPVVEYLGYIITLMAIVVLVVLVIIKGDFKIQFFKEEISQKDEDLD